MACAEIAGQQVTQRAPLDRAVQASSIGAVGVEPSAHAHF
jgi:hypothetical protein